MAWYPALGSAIFFIGLIASIVLYIIRRKWHPVLYIVSACVYIFTVGFVIDVFQLKRDGILLTLAISSLLMVAVGAYLAKSGSSSKVVKK